MRSRAGFQTSSAHAIEDRANRGHSTIHVRVASGTFRRTTAFGLEHAQLLTPRISSASAGLGVFPSMRGKPPHQRHVMGREPYRAGSALQWVSYVWRSLRNTGVIIPNGSDAPVESINPLVSLSLVHHQAVIVPTMRNPAGGWVSQLSGSRAKRRCSR